MWADGVTSKGKRKEGEKELRKGKAQIIESRQKLEILKTEGIQQARCLNTMCPAFRKQVLRHLVFLRCRLPVSACKETSVRTSGASRPKRGGRSGGKSCCMRPRAGAALHSPPAPKKRRVRTAQTVF